jgi:hypothetical protein
MSRSTKIQSNYPEVTEIMASDRGSEGRRSEAGGGGGGGVMGGGLNGEERQNE